MKHLFQIALLLVVATTLTAAQNPSVTVEGFAVDLLTNRPLSKVTLDLHSTTNADLRYPAVTSSEGKFTFRGVAPGPYSLGASRAGYVRSEYGQRGPNGNTSLLTVAPGQSLADVRISMVQSGEISGRIAGKDGEPSANAQIRAWKISYKDDWRLLVPVDSQVTNDLGEYRLFGLPPGQYYVTAQPDPPEFIRSPSYAGLPPPMPGAVVISKSAGQIGGVGDPANASRTDAGAEWTPVYFGGNTEQASATPIVLHAGNDLRGIDITVDHIPFDEIGGMVIDGTSGQPARSAKVAVTPLIPGVGPTAIGDSVVQYGKQQVSLRAPVSVFGNGQLHLPPLPHGSYLLTGISDQQGNRMLGQTRLDVGAAGNPDVRITLAPARDVAGRIVIEGRPGGVADPDMANLSVGLASTATSFADVAPTSPSPAGAFTLRNVGAIGDYRIRVAIPSSLKNAYVKSVRAGDIDVLNDGLRLAGVTQSPIEVVIGLNAGAVSGVVRGEDRIALSNVSVVLIPEESQRNRGELYRKMESDTFGRYRFERIPPGRYRLFAWEDVEIDSWRDPNVVRLDEDRSKEVTVTEGTESNVDLAMIRLR